mmetsp:Transcript_17229/g.31000  ORF Transcript_17229/g.31000 Transcript_17229/m.31000 type:complete len:463 (-) Transcript_17229:8982-10370(-)
MELTPCVPLHASTPPKTCKRFQFQVTDKTRMLVVKVVPTDGDSDPDLYLSVNDPEVSQENFTWRATSFGEAKIEVMTEDPDYQIGTYYVGVYAYSPVPNNFYVVHEFLDPVAILPLDEFYEGPVNDWTYFKFELQHPGYSRVCIDAGGGFAMFVSGHIYYPSVEDHTFSAGYYENGRVNFTASERFALQYTDLDPYDSKVPRNFFYKPMIPDAPVRASPEDPCRLCIETESWKKESKLVYLAVKNMKDAPSTLTLRKTELHENDLISEEDKEFGRYFESIFEEMPGSIISTTERKRLDVEKESEFTYGEIEVFHFKLLLDLCKPKPGQVFWDLGCGAGKCLVAASLLFPSFSVVKGVEYLPALSNLCKINAAKVSRPHAPIEVHEGDILEVDWSDADLIFTSSICFPDRLVAGMLEKARQLKTGALIITLRTLPQNSDFKVIAKLNVRMSWGNTGAYILEKL